jgi:hypothetical protein
MRCPFILFLFLNFILFFCFRLQRRSLEMKKVMATLRAIVEVMKSLSKDADPDGVGRLIIEEVHAFCTPTLDLTFKKTVQHIILFKTYLCILCNLCICHLYLGFTSSSLIV